jgi:hypothetical protein
VRDAQPRRDHSGRIEREGKVGHHAAIDAIAGVIYGPPDGQALLIVDHDDIELRVIDLHEIERSLCAVENAGLRRKLIDRSLRWDRRPWRSRGGIAAIRSRTVLAFGARSVNRANWPVLCPTATSIPKDSEIVPETG